MKSSFILFLITLAFLFKQSIQAELLYQQDFTISSWRSLEDVQQRAQKFCNAAKDDKDIKVINVTFKECREKKKRYDAIIECQVSKIDLDLMRIMEKVLQKKDGVKN